MYASKEMLLNPRNIILNKKLLESSNKKISIDKEIAGSSKTTHYNWFKSTDSQIDIEKEKDEFFHENQYHRIANPPFETQEDKDEEIVSKTQEILKKIYPWMQSSRI